VRGVLGDADRSQYLNRVMIPEPGSTVPVVAAAFFEV
jgi:hypothetical protein